MDSHSPVSREDIAQLWATVADRTLTRAVPISDHPRSAGRLIGNRRCFWVLGGQRCFSWHIPGLRRRLINTQTSGQIHLEDFTTPSGYVHHDLWHSRSGTRNFRYLYQLHTRIQGEIPESVAASRRGSHYEANEVEALRWVHATLGESALPADWSAFEAYNRMMWASDTLGVNTLSREMAHRILHGRGSWVPVPHWYRALTAAWMPDGLREAFALPHSEREERAVPCALRWLPRVYRRIPCPLRYVGPYQEARARLQGRNVGLLARASNRFWMGQSRMLFPKPEC